MGEAIASGPPMRLLMLSHYFEARLGGIEMVAAALAHSLPPLGFSVVWLASGAAGDSRGSGCSRRSLRTSSVAERLLRIPYPILFPSAWRAIFREAGHSDIILVHDALYMTSILGWLAARAHRKPFVIVQHIGFVPYEGAALRTLMKLANRCVAVPLLRRANRVVFISQLTQRYFSRIRWRATPALIYNGVDTTIFRPASSAEEVEANRKQLGLPVDIPVALFVGRFTPKKGLRILERTARIRPDICFACAGQGELDPTRWGLENVRVYASLSGSALASLYRASDLLVLPSVGEGFPLVVQEALACGLPIVCGSDTAGADSRAAAFLSGVELDFADPDRTASQVSEELTRILARPASPSQRRERFEFARTHYSWARSSSSYAELLRDLRARTLPS